MVLVFALPEPPGINETGERGFGLFPELPNLLFGGSGIEYPPLGQIGERICAPLKSFRLVLPVIRHHHERFDGSGYPDGLRGEEIPLTARVLQVVDVYDALTTQRPYKSALSQTEALTLMEAEVEKGWWDPNVFTEFQQMSRAFHLKNCDVGRESEEC